MEVFCTVSDVSVFQFLLLRQLSFHKLRSRSPYFSSVCVCVCARVSARTRFEGSFYCVGELPVLLLCDSVLSPALGSCSY